MSEGARLHRPLHHVRRGSGEPLLLLHGLGASLAIWDPVLDRLAERRHVIAVDMPGFGRSPALPDGVEASAPNLCRAVLDFYDTLGVGADPDVCGNSLGGWIAIECARLGRARSVVGLCTAGFWKRPIGARPNRSRPAARLIAPFAAPLMASERLKRLVLGSQMRHPERVSREQAAGLVRSYGRASGYEAADEEMRGNVIGDLSAIEVPLTLAWAEHDMLVRRRPVRGLPPSIHQPVIPDAGHVPTWDAPELVAALILGARDSTREPHQGSTARPPSRLSPGGGTSGASTSAR